MFKIKLTDIQKVKPEFKKEDIVSVHFAQCVGNGQRADMIHLICGEVIQVTSDGLMLFSNEFGYLDMENSLLASYLCYNAQGKYSYTFEIQEEVLQRDAAYSEMCEELIEDEDEDDFSNNDYNDDYQGEEDEGTIDDLD